MMGSGKQLLVGAAVGALTAVSPAAAQDAADPGPAAASNSEIVVTAQKREERLLDVPAPISALSGEALTNSGQVRIQDYIARVPGVSFITSGNGSEPLVVIRGVSTGGDTNPLVGFVVDDAPYGSSIVAGPNVVSPADIDPGDIARIEVLRGPQGTLYGAGAMGGLLKYVTIDPSLDRFSGRLMAGVSTTAHGDDFGYQVRGSLNLPVGETMALRASGFRLKEAGYVDNLQTGEDDVNAFESKGARLTLLWKPSADWAVRLSGFIQQSARTGSGVIHPALDPKGYVKRELVGTGDYRRTSKAVNLNVSGSIGAVNLTSVTSLSRDRSYNDVDTSTNAFLALFYTAPPFNVTNAYSFQNKEAQKFSQELRADVPLGDAVNLLVGGFYTDEDYALTADNVAANSAGENVGSIFLNDYRPQEYKEYALFGTLVADFTDQLQFQIGGRYSDNRSSGRTTFSGPGAALIFGSSPFVQGQFTSKDNSFTYTATLRYKLAPDLALYARYATGYRPGGGNIGCGHPQVPCFYRDDRTRNFDIGLKGKLANGAIDIDASVYQIDWTNIQLSSIPTTDFAFFYTDNLAKARIRGLETYIEVRPVGGVQLSGTFSYTDAEVRSSGLSPLAFIDVAPGERLPFSTRYSANLSIDYVHEISADAELQLGASWTYVGERLGLFKDTGISRLVYPSYSQFDLTAKADFGDWAVGAFVKNLTDKRGVLAQDEVNPAFISIIQPRTVGITVSRDF